MITNKSTEPLEIQRAVWIGATSYEEGAAVEHRGFWTGDDHEVFMMPNGQERTYYAAQAGLQLDPIRYTSGNVIQTTRVSLGPLRSYVEDYVRGFNLRGARAEIHVFSRRVGTLAWTIERAFLGMVDSVEHVDSDIDERGNSLITLSLGLVSRARLGTRTLALKKSDASQRRVNTLDRGRRYGDVSGDIQVTWMGESKHPHEIGIVDRRQA